MEDSGRVELNAKQSSDSKERKEKKRRRERERIEKT
jgi:hypothetical protein